MNKEYPFSVTSEIGRLKKVMLHRPGKEIERLTPELLEMLLFDDIPYLKIAQEEHDKFADLLRSNGVEIVYLEDLIAEAIGQNGVREKFIEQFLDEGSVYSKSIRDVVKEYLKHLSDIELVRELMAGIKKDVLPEIRNKSLNWLAERDYPFVLDPIPNLYFTRDPFVTVGSGIVLNHMKRDTRNRETIFAEYIFKYHPVYGRGDFPLYYSRYENTALEGGDILVLSDKILAIGISHRTDALSVEKVAKNILLSEREPFQVVLAFKIPEKRAFMHLDTVFTMIDYDKFTIHSEIEGPLEVFSLTLDEDKNLMVKKEKAVLEDILKKYLELDNIKFIRCAGGDFIDARREQWNDGSNTLAISPGEVVVYSRNYVTNRLLEENGVKLHIIESSEISRGRGGPRCMSMPMEREVIKSN